MVRRESEESGWHFLVKYTPDPIKVNTVIGHVPSRGKLAVALSIQVLLGVADRRQQGSASLDRILVSKLRVGHRGKIIAIPASMHLHSHDAPLCSTRCRSIHSKTSLRISGNSTCAQSYNSMRQSRSLPCER